MEKSRWLISYQLLEIKKAQRVQAQQGKSKRRRRNVGDRRADCQGLLAREISLEEFNIRKHLKR